MKISTKLYLGFGFVIVLLILIAGGSILQLTQLSHQSREIASEIWPKVQLLSQGLAGVNEISLGARDMVFAGENDGRQAGKTRMLDGRANIGKAWEKLGPMLTKPEGKAMFEAIMDSRRQFIAQQNKLIELVEAGQHDAAASLLKGEYRAVAVEYRKRVVALTEYQGRLMSESAQSAENSAESTRNVIVGLSLLAIVLASVAAFLISRQIVGAVNQAVDAASRMAEGELDLRIDAHGNDELAHLLRSIASLAERLRGVLGDVRGASEQIATVAHDMATATGEVSRAGEVQAQASSSSAAALEEVTVSINEVSNLTQESQESACRASEAAREGVDVIQEATGEIDGMLSAVSESSVQVQGLLRRSEEIGGIASVIRDIADQTNLLALNAAIEAARAGEQGRGFAVVADEARKLAERTAKATTEIGGLVTGIQQETGQAKAIMDLGAGSAASQSAESESAMHSMQRLLSLSQDMQDNIASSSRLANAELANIEELTLKLEVYKVLLGLSDLKPGELPDETQCRLGRWYYEGEGRAEFSRLPGYREMEGPHKAVHDQARQAVECYRSGDFAGALDALTRMEEANLTVMAGMERILAQGPGRAVAP